MIGTREHFRILEESARLRGLSDRELNRKAQACRMSVSMGRPLRQLLPEVYALAIEATRRVLGKVHYPVQVLGGIAIFRGKIAEMQTGEGKTLTALLPVALRAMAGRGTHVLTSNEYLATRDCEQLGPVYSLLGLTSGYVVNENSDEQRRHAYRCDITYTTATEIGFDFLRDRLRSRACDDLASRKSIFMGQEEGERVLRELHFAMIDEADSILIDDARTPLIIGANRPAKKGTNNRRALFAWARVWIQGCVVNRDYKLNLIRKTAELTKAGARRAALAAKPPELDEFDSETIYKHIETALAARDLYTRDIDYVVREDRTVAIIDEGTGRVLEGRKWQDGLHESIEEKEGVLEGEGEGTGYTAATVMLQTLFRRYEHLAGMTGTAWQVRRELWRDYRLRVQVIPTNRTCARYGLPRRVFTTRRHKYAAIAIEVRRMVALDRAVLIGTPSVEASEELSEHLREAGIAHQILNCRMHAEEAAIIASAGTHRAVTVATNMAGRGTDIIPDSACREAGGLHVIATEHHTSRRIDRQLIGRAARQGDPGSYQFFVSFEDELLRGLEDRRLMRLRKRVSLFANAQGELPAAFGLIILSYQRRVTRRQARERKVAHKQEKQRLRQFAKLSLDPFVELT